MNLGEKEAHFAFVLGERRHRRWVDVAVRCQARGTWPGEGVVHTGEDDAALLAVSRERSSYN